MRRMLLIGASIVWAGALLSVAGREIAVSAAGDAVTDDLDQELASVLAAEGFTGRIEFTLVQRLGRPINDKPLTDPTFTDRRFLYQTPYVYVVRAISQGPEQTVESSDSERLAVTPRDTFPPSAPTSAAPSASSPTASRPATRRPGAPRPADPTR